MFLASIPLTATFIHASLRGIGLAFYYELSLTISGFKSAAFTFFVMSTVYRLKGFTYATNASDSTPYPTVRGITSMTSFLI